MDHSSPASQSLTLKVREMVNAGRLGAARPLLRALQHMEGENSEVCELRARLLMKEGRLPEAVAAADQGIAAAPEHQGLRCCRAELRLQTDDLLGAASDAAEAVILNRTDPAAKAILGFALLELEQVEDAQVCLKEAALARPENESIARGLAEAQHRNGDYAGAAATLATAVLLNPNSVSLRNSAILLAIRQRDFEAGLRLAEEARKAGVVNACIFGLKGHALSSVGRHEEAAEAYAEALKLGPEDPYVRHLVAAAGGVPGGDRAPLAYLRAVFNNYAETFETHLISLGYRIPGLVRSTLLEVLPQPKTGELLGPVLDLGCGTGLVPVVLSDLPIGPFIGIDISPGMLARARGKGLYSELREQDVVVALHEDTEHYAVVIGADVLCYFGALDEIFAGAYSRLKPGGIFIFSVETSLPDDSSNSPVLRDWVLGRMGRYAHAQAYVLQRAELAGFHVRSVQAETLREEALEPVKGIIVTLERVRASH